MGNIKKRYSKAYILLESLLAMALLSVLVTIVLNAVVQSRQQLKAKNLEIEALNVAQMAVDTGQESLQINDVNITVRKTASKIIIFNREKELLVLEKN